MDEGTTRLQTCEPGEGSALLGGTIGPYRLLSVLGEGGFGIVYLAERREPPVQRVALKVIRPGMDSDAVLARFEQERQALAVMDHPNVARVFDGGVTPSGRPYFVMEYVHGERITTYCDRERLTLRARLELFIPVCEAVQHAHMKGIIHRDLKPSNVLVEVVDGKAIPKVIDFGVAKAMSRALTDKTIFTERGELIGTPEYMSPEQAEMGATDVDTRTDVYALGTMLYELVTGALPFDSQVLRQSGFGEVQRIIREVEPPRPSTKLSSLGATGTQAAALRRASLPELCGALRRELEWIPLKAIRKGRAERYATALDLAADIRNYLDGRPLVAGPESTAYRLRKFTRRNRGPIAAAAVVALSLVAGVIGTGAFALREQRARLEADRRRSETERIAAFQESMLSGIDAQRMGQGLVQSLKQEARASLEARMPALASSEVESRVQELDSMLGGANATSVAVKSLDENILARAESAIRDKFGDQPVVKAALLQTIASVLHDLGLDLRAEPAQREALAIRRAALGDDAAETIVSIGSLGSLLKSQGRLNDARPLLREAMDRAGRVLGPENPETLHRTHNYADLLIMANDLKDAEAVERNLLAARRRVLGNDNPDTIESVGALGVCLYKQRRYEEAEPYYREAVQSYRRILGNDEPRTLVAISNMGYELRARGRLAEAMPLWREALETRRRTLGNEHPDTLLSLITYAQALYQQNNKDEAAAGLQEAVATAKRVLAPGHPLRLTAVQILGAVDRDLGKLPEAERAFRDDLESQRRLHGADDPTLAAALSNLGEVLALSGGATRATEAEALLRECVAMRTRLFPDGNPQAWRRRDASSLLGESLLIQAQALASSQPEKALARLREARPLIVDSAEWMLKDPGMPPKTATADRALDAAKRAVRLFETLDKMEPNAGHAAEGAAWRTKVVERAGSVGRT